LTEHLDNPEILAERAHSDYRAGEFDRAAQGFSAASDHYQASGDPLHAAEMKNNLCVCLLQLDRADEALSVVRETPLIFHNANDMLQKARALGNRAMAKAALGQADEAESDYRSAADIFRNLGQEEDLQYTMQALSRIQLQQGRPMEALNAMQSVLDGKGRPSLRDRFLSWLFKFPMRLLGR
jgi:tetratricopeptide (TPR) repeat protein